MKLKIFKQSDGFCGPTSLRMVPSHYKIKSTESHLIELTHATKEDGCDPEDLVRAAKHYALKAEFTQNNSIYCLEHTVKRVGIPVIVGWFSFSGEPHYSVVIDFKKNKVVYADPEFGEIRKINKQLFVDRWFDFYNFPPKSNLDLIIKGMVTITE